MDWLVVNAADLAGHLVTILVFLGGFVVLRRKARADFLKEVRIRQFDNVLESVKRLNIEAEKLRIAIYLLAIRDFDRGQQLDKETEQRLMEISELRAAFFGDALFAPSELEAPLTNLRDLYKEFSDTIAMPNDTKGKNEKTEMNKKTQQAVFLLQEASESWRKRIETLTEIWRELQLAPLAVNRQLH